MGTLSQAFAQAGVPDSASDARRLLCAAAGLDHASLIRDPDAPLGDEVAVRLESYAARRIAREPATRILAERGFWSLDLVVAPHVLDPRPDSETLVDAALDAMRDRQADRLAIADLGSGSGALLCALLDVFAHASGVAIDLSPEACALSARNLRRCGFSARARVVHGDWSAFATDPFDLIVSNPPYIASGDIAGLDPEVRDHDPALALDGGADGLDAYRSLAATLPRLLKADGVAVVELGAGQRAAAATIFSKAGMRPVGARRDLGEVERALLLKHG